MAYSDFDALTVEEQFGVRILPGIVFPSLVPAPIPGWLTDTFARTSPFRIASEKARSEFLIAPILVAVREQSGGAVAIFSGERFDVEPTAGLAGECDFLLALCPPTPVIRAPLITIVEAKRQDIESGVGQCAAQMIASRRFNERHGRQGAVVYGCVTTGEDWQFLRHDGSTITYDIGRYYLSDLGLILAAFAEIVVVNRAHAAA